MTTSSRGINNLRLEISSLDKMQDIQREQTQVNHSKINPITEERRYQREMKKQTHENRKTGMRS